MNISIMGDSISTYEGFIPAGYELFYTDEKRMANGIESADDTWWMQVLHAMGAQLLVNNSYSGSQVTGEEFPCASGIERTSSLGRDGASPDLILIYIGVNDFGFAVPCDRYYAESPDEPTFHDAYATMLRRMQANYPAARIVCGTVLTPCIAGDPAWSFNEKWHDRTPLAEYNERIRQAAQETGALVADLAGAAEKSDLLYETHDGLHPNKRGHKQIAALWTAELERLEALAKNQSM